MGFSDNGASVSIPTGIRASTAQRKTPSPPMFTKGGGGQICQQQNKHNDKPENDRGKDRESEKTKRCSERRQNEVQWSI